MRFHFELLGLFSGLLLTIPTQGKNCRCGPDDACWPAKHEWDKLNSTVNGRLIKTVPIGAICHYSFENKSYYDAEGCAKLKASWSFPDPHLASSSSPMQQFDILSGLQFVKNHNLRLVVRNTGHDDLGRSIGHAALGIWLHYITDIKYDPEYSSPGYNGPAVRVGAGVLSGNLIANLAKLKMVAITGACSTVGVAGGYTPGGGHSILSSLYGLGADNTLEFEVITASGAVVTASPAQNSDLYWALSGGGSGNYGIVWSMTIKTFLDMKVGAASLSFTTGNHTSDQFLEVIDTWNSLAPNITQAGAWSYSDFAFLPENKGTFSLEALVGPNLTVMETQNLLIPLIQKLDRLGFSYKYNTSSYTTYYEAYNSLLTFWPVGGIGSRLIPRTTIEQDGKKLLAVENMILKMGYIIDQLTFKAGLPGGSSQENAILPAWRDSNIHLLAGFGSSNGAKNHPLMVEKQANITNIILPELEKLVPDGGAYMNEGDVFDPNWKTNFYGSNYGRLLQVKRRWDP